MKVKLITVFMFEIIDKLFYIKSNNSLPSFSSIACKINFALNFRFITNFTDEALLKFL